MATSQPAATENLKLTIDGKAIELVITTRGNGLDTGYRTLSGEKPPQADELAKLIPATIRTWLNVWRAIQDDSWKLTDDKKSACETIGILESSFDPYVTVWNKDWNGLSVTVHSWDNGQAALDNAARHKTGLEMFSKYAQALGVQIFGQPMPPPQAPTIPEAPAIPVTDEPAPANVTPFPQAGESKQFKPSRKISDTLIQIETGKKDSPAWKDVQLASKHYDWKTVQYEDGMLVAYPIDNAIEVRDTMNNVQAVISTSMGRFQFYRNKKDSTEQTFDWQTFESQLFSVGYETGLLVPGFKAWLHGYVIIKFAHSNGKEYANLYGFRALPADTSKAS